MASDHHPDFSRYSNLLPLLSSLGLLRRQSRPPSLVERIRIGVFWEASQWLWDILAPAFFLLIINGALPLRHTKDYSFTIKRVGVHLHSYRQCWCFQVPQKSGHQELPPHWTGYHWSSYPARDSFHHFQTCSPETATGKYETYSTGLCDSLLSLSQFEVCESSSLKFLLSSLGTAERLSTASISGYSFFDWHLGVKLRRGSLKLGSA